jgi:hypothetical protein
LCCDNEGRGKALKLGMGWQVKYVAYKERSYMWLEKIAHCRRDLWFVHPVIYYMVDEQKEDEMGGACSMFGGEEKFIF